MRSDYPSQEPNAHHCILADLLKNTDALVSAVEEQEYLFVLLPAQNEFWCWLPQRHCTTASTSATDILSWPEGLAAYKGVLHSGRM